MNGLGVSLKQRLTTINLPHSTFAPMDFTALVDQLIYQPIQVPPKGNQTIEASRPWPCRLPLEKTIDVVVKVLKGATYDLKVHVLDSIESVKQQLEPLTQTKSQDMRLLFKGKPLTTLISDYPITAGATLHLSLKSSAPSEQVASSSQPQVLDEPLIKDTAGFWQKIQNAIHEHVKPSEQALMLQSFKNNIPQ